jgi:glycerol-3-phosphate acyltransferase PlsY
LGADIALVIGAYLLGSVPHLSLLARLRHVGLNGDFHQSLWYQGGRLIAIVGILGEFVKGVIAVLAGKWLGFELPVVALAGLAVVSGQMWPIFSRFDGEKGNSVAIPMAIALTPKPALIAMAPTIIAIVIRTLPRLMNSSKSPTKESVFGGAYSRSLPLGIAITFFILPLVSWYLGEPPEIILCYSALFILIIVRRITAGLKRDLRENRNILAIVINRFLYDRAAKEWRKERPIER